MSEAPQRKKFPLVTFLVIIITVTIVGIIAYALYYRSHIPDVKDGEVVPVTAEVPAAPEIKTPEDLDDALSTLEKADTSSSNDRELLNDKLSEF